jgi:hypothetical protein
MPKEASELIHPLKDSDIEADFFEAQLSRRRSAD